MNRSPLFYNLILAGWTLSTMAFWALAFLPNEQTSPEWLLASRNACFGTLESGLPDAGGWIMLVASPLTFLFGIFLVWSKEIRESMKKMFSSALGKITVTGLLALVVFEGVLVVEKLQAGVEVEQVDLSSPIEGDLPEHYLRTEKKAPLFEHVNQRGEKTSLLGLLKKHKTVTLSFAFAQCKTVCPMIVSKLKKAASRVDKESSAFVVVTLDPWRDTPSAIASWAGKVNLPENAHILTGSVEEIQKTLEAYNIPRARNEKTGDVQHPPLTYVIDSEARIAYSFGNVPPKWITQAVKRIAN